MLKSSLLLSLLFFVVSSVRMQSTSGPVPIQVISGPVPIPVAAGPLPIPPPSGPSCGPYYGNCDYLVTVSLFQIGTCGRAARCNWELLHLKKALKGDTSSVQKYESKITEALCLLPTFEMHRNYSMQDENKKWYKILEDRECNKKKDNCTDFNFYPMPTLYTFKYPTLKPIILEGIERCIELETACAKELDDEITSLCDQAITPANIEKIKPRMHLKIRGQPAYQFSNVDGSQPNRNKCALDILTRQKVKSGKDKGNYKDVYLPNAIHPRLRPPYFDLSVLYMIDPLQKMGALPVEDRWWSEEKAYRELANYLRPRMVQAMHKAIQSIYEKAKPRAGTVHGGKQLSLVWKPEKFCQSWQAIICVDKAKLKPETCGATPDPPKG